MSSRGYLPPVADSDTPSLRSQLEVIQAKDPHLFLPT